LNNKPTSHAERISNVLRIIKRYESDPLGRQAIDNQIQAIILIELMSHVYVKQSNQMVKNVKIEHADQHIPKRD